MLPARLRLIQNSHLRSKPFLDYTMTTVTHKIFSQDVEVGRIELLDRNRREIIAYGATSLFSVIAANIYRRYWLIDSSVHLSCDTLADAFYICRDYPVIAIAEVDAYLNPKPVVETVFELTPIQSFTTNSQVLKDAVAKEIKKSGTEGLTTLFLLIDAELKHRRVQKPNLVQDPTACAAYFDRLLGKNND